MKRLSTLKRKWRRCLGGVPWFKRFIAALRKKPRLSHIYDDVFVLWGE